MCKCQITTKLRAYVDSEKILSEKWSLISNTRFMIERIFSPFTSQKFCIFLQQLLSDSLRPDQQLHFTANQYLNMYLVNSFLCFQLRTAFVTNNKIPRIGASSMELSLPCSLIFPRGKTNYHTASWKPAFRWVFRNFRTRGRIQLTVEPMSATKIFKDESDSTFDLLSLQVQQ